MSEALGTLRPEEIINRVRPDHQSIKQYEDGNNRDVLVLDGVEAAALKAGHIGQDFGAHNISEAYLHDYVGVFKFSDGVVGLFEEFKGDIT